MAQTVKNPPAMRETGAWSLGWEDPLEEGMATRSSILAWRIPWTEEPGGPQPMGSQSWIWLRDWAEAGHTSPRLRGRKRSCLKQRNWKPVTKFQSEAAWDGAVKTCAQELLRDRNGRGGGGLPMSVLDKSRFQMKQEADEWHTEFQGLWH